MYVYVLTFYILIINFVSTIHTHTYNYIQIYSIIDLDRLNRLYIVHVYMFVSFVITSL